MPIYKTGKKNNDGVQQYRVTYNYTDPNGKYRQKTKLVYGLSEAKFTEAMFNSKPTAEETQNITVKQLYDKYVESQKNEVRETSLEKTKCNLKKYVLPSLAKTKLDKLTVSALQQWKNSISEADIKIRTKKNIYKIFNAMLNYAVKMEYMNSNPLKKVGNFKDVYDFNKPEEKIQYYTSEEYKKFIGAQELNTARDWAFYTFFSIAFYTGMRKGEINALRWCDIDNNILSVTRSVTQKITGKNDIFTPPKNESSYRKLQIPIPLMNILEQQKEVQKKEIRNWDSQMLVCGGQIPLRDTSLSNKNKELSERAGLQTIRIHDFRHTHATLLINEGINAQEIARRLGHSDATITLKVYAHLYPREEERAMKILNNI